MSLQACCVDGVVGGRGGGRGLWAETPGRRPAGPDGREGGATSGKPALDSVIPEEVPMVSREHYPSLAPGRQMHTSPVSPLHSRGYKTNQNHERPLLQDRPGQRATLGERTRSRKSASGPQQCRPARLALACALPALLRLTLLSCVTATHGHGVRATPQRLWEAGSEEASGQSLRRSLRGRVGNGEGGEARGGTRRQGSPGAGEGRRQTQQVARGKGWGKEAKKTSRRNDSSTRPGRRE